VKQAVETAIQRTLVLTLGEAGAAVGQRLVQMLDEWGTPPVVAVRHLNPGSESAEVIEAALHEISRLAHRTAMHSLGYEPDRLDELVVWVVGSPDTPVASVAHLAAERAAALLGLDPLTLGLALWDSLGERRREQAALENPPALQAGAPADELPDEHRREQAALENPAPALQAGAPADELPGERRREQAALENPAPALQTGALSLTGPCYLVTLVNEAGLMLDDLPALYEQAARFLALHTCTPLRDAPAWMEQASDWSDGLGYASFGLTWLAWPGATAQARAARQLAESLSPLLMGAPDGVPDGDALLREAALAPALLAPRLTPSAAAEVVRLAANDIPSLAPWTLLRPSGEADHPLVEQIEATVGERSDALTGCAPAWERLMQAGIKATIAQVRAWVAQALDAGGLSQARALVTALERRLGEWAAGAEQRLEEAQEGLTRTERDGEAVLAELISLLEKMPRRRLRELLRLLRNPPRWAWLWLRWRQAQGFHAHYLLLQAAALETRVVIEQMKQACGVYWAAGAELQSVSRELDRLEQRLCDLFSVAEEAPGWPRLPLLLGDDPDALLAQLAERYLPTPQTQATEFLAQWGPLSRWWAEGLPNRAAVDGWLMEQVAPLAAVPVWEVARCRYPQPDGLRTWVEELAAQASPLWRWDPAALSDDERARMGDATVLLSAPDGDAPWDDDLPGPSTEFIPSRVEGLRASLRMLPLPRADWLAVVTLRWGIPSR